MLTRSNLQKALDRESAKLVRQLEAVEASEAMIELLEQQIKNEKIPKGA